MKSDLWVGIAAVCFLFIACPAFFVWAPWTTALTVTEATERYPGQIDPNWRAVTMNHGHPSEWPWGTVAENPLGFAACTALLGLGIAPFLYCIYLGRQVRADGERRTN